MKVLVFDTETTGLPKTKNPSIFDFEKWPYIVQLSYILYDTENKSIDDLFDHVIRLPEHVEIDKEAENLHHISKEKSLIAGINIKEALNVFNEALNKADIIVGHNISFDKCLVMVECNRNNLRQAFTVNHIKKLEYCTMKNSKDICKIEKISENGNKYFKYPKLSELHYTLFNSVPDNCHNSLVDIILCLRCYIKIVNGIDLFDINEEIKTLLDPKNHKL